jgi:hypothetical protein
MTTDTNERLQLTPAFHWMLSTHKQEIAHMAAISLQCISPSPVSIFPLSRASTIGSRPPETNLSTVTSWLPLTKTYSVPSGSSSAVWARWGVTSNFGAVAFDPNYGVSVKHKFTLSAITSFIVVVRSIELHSLYHEYGVFFCISAC